MIDSQDTSLHTEKISLSGMRCASCAKLIEHRVHQIPGVNSIQINNASHTATITWQVERVQLGQIIHAIGDLGYGAFPYGQTAQNDRERKMTIWRLFVAGFAMMQVMMYAFPAYLVPNAEIDGDLTPDLDRLLKLASMFLAIPVLFFSSTPFFKSAWRDIKNKTIGMDVPVSLGILLTFFASVWASFKGGAVYFDSMIMFVFLLLGARMIEEGVQKKTTSALRAVTDIAPESIKRLTNFPESHSSEDIEAHQLNVGDVVLVASGSSVPADGVIVAGDGACDESLMTGESQPVTKTIGSTVIAGSVNVGAPFIMKTEKVGGQTQLSALIGMMEKAANEKPALVLLADKHASRFLIIILILAFISATVWSFIDPSRALWIAVSVIVVTCPCALSLATPGVMAAAIGILAKRGVLMVKSKAVQGLAESNHFVFDKTGTLTRGKLTVTERIASSTALELEQTYTEIAAALAHASSHPVAQAIYSHCKTEKTDIVLTEIREITGAGISGKWAGVEYVLGNPSYVETYAGVAVPLPAEWHDRSVSILVKKGEALISFSLEDKPRRDAAEMLKNLKALGADVSLLSGDRAGVVKSLAQTLDIAHAQGGLSPDAKYQIILEMQKRGHGVVMVGDGMNDGPALSLADVSIAMGQGAPISQTRSDIVLMSNRLADLEFAVRISRKAFRLIRENLIWAIVYNAIAIPLAVFGVLEPWHAAVGMSLSSLIVVLNALRLYRVPAPQINQF